MKKLDFSKDKELKKLQEIVEQLPEDKRRLTEALVVDAAFMAEQMDKLRNYIAENGWSEEYYNGANQHGKKSSTEADAYLKMQRQYLQTVKQLADMLPSSELSSVPGTEIMSFLNGRDD